MTKTAQEMVIEAKARIREIMVDQFKTMMDENTDLMILVSCVRSNLTTPRQWPPVAPGRQSEFQSPVDPSHCKEALDTRH